MEVLSAFGGGSDGLRQRTAGGGGVSGVVAGLAGGAVGGGERKEKEPWKNWISTYHCSRPELDFAPNSTISHQIERRKK